MQLWLTTNLMQIPIISNDLTLQLITVRIFENTLDYHFNQQVNSFSFFNINKKHLSLALNKCGVASLQTHSLNFSASLPMNFHALSTPNCYSFSYDWFCLIKRQMLIEGL